MSQSSDYEIILVDDGSTDRSPELCDDYRQRYPSLVRVIHKGIVDYLLHETQG